MRSSTKKTLLIVGVACVLIMIVGFLTSGFTAWDKDSVADNVARKVNPDNLYTVDAVSLKDSNDGYGIVVDVDEKTGAITLDGIASKDMEFTVGTVTLPKGTYTLTASNKSAMNGVYVTATIGATVYNFDFTPGNTISLDTESSAVIKIHIANEAELNNIKILPVIVEGDEAGNFYK